MAVDRGTVSQDIDGVCLLAGAWMPIPRDDCPASPPFTWKMPSSLPLPPRAAFLTHQEHRASVPALVPNSHDDQGTWLVPFPPTS